jgi:hypothetical protein
MRKVAITVIAALSLVLLSAVPALAAGGGGPQSGSISIWGTPDKGSGVYIYGTLNVPNGTSGIFTVYEYGSKGPGKWGSASDSTVIHVVKGQTSYGFSFDEKGPFSQFEVEGGGIKSRILNRDECGFRVPEAPSSALLMIGALPVVGLVGMRVTGIRLPLPHWTRIA